MDSSLGNDLSETIKKLEDISVEDIHSRHRKERKELQAKIQALKKNAPKSDKKKRKGVLDEISKLEADLNKKQQMEIKQAEDMESEHDNLAQKKSHEIYDNSSSNPVEKTEDVNDSQQRVSKAQRRRDKKACEARRREEEIKSSVEDGRFAPKAIEAKILKSKLKDRQLALFNILSDGDCLFNAIRHQLLQHGQAVLGVKELRAETANYIQSNKDSLIPYMTHPENGHLLTDEEFQNYCDDLRYTHAWGGQIELKALSSVLKVPIEVLQANGSPTVLGSEFDGTALIITYHRHLYSLGEHYNSTIPLTEELSEEDNSENECN